MKLPSLLALLLLPLAALSDDALVEVFATGVGSTQDEAMKAANRAAVVKVVGTIVDFSRVVSNDEIEDRILDYSAGVIAASEIVEGPTATPDGLFSVKVRATVRKTDLRNRLAADRLVSSDLDGRSLWAAAVSEEERLRNAESMIRNVLGKRTACLIAREVAGRNGVSPLDRDPKTGETFATIRIRLDEARYRALVSVIRERLGPIAEDRVSYKGSGDDRNHYFKPPTYKGRLLDTKNVLVVIDDLRSRRATALRFGKNEFDVVEEQCGKCVALRVSLLDAEGTVLASQTERILTSDQNLCVLARSEDWGRRNGYPCAVAPLCGGHFDYDGQMVDAFGHDPWKDRVRIVSMGYFSIDELKRIAKIRVELGYLVGDGGSLSFEPAPVQSEAIEPEADHPSTRSAPKPRAAAMPAALRPLHSALQALRAAEPRTDAINRVASLWSALPDPYRESLLDDVVALSCAGYLAVGAGETFSKARARLRDPARFAEETTECCAACSGSGKVSVRCTICNGSSRCTRCRGAGVLRAPRLSGMGAPAARKCPGCGGSGRCSSCHDGRRETGHADCNGTGRIVSHEKCLEAFSRHVEEALLLCETL